MSGRSLARLIATSRRCVSRSTRIVVVVLTTTAYAERPHPGRGVLRQRNTGGGRYRVFEATEVIGIFAGLERTDRA